MRQVDACWMRRVEGCLERLILLWILRKLRLGFSLRRLHGLWSFGVRLFWRCLRLLSRCFDDFLLHEPLSFVIKGLSGRLYVALEGVPKREMEPERGGDL